MSKKKQRQKMSEDISMLDELIERYLKTLLKNVDENVKMGDFLKMIELRRKLTPADSDQKMFWKMLDRIRKETLGKKKNKSLLPVPASKQTRNKQAKHKNISNSPQTV
ncbi:MAG: hypothetical protein ACE5D6_03245 [Candidatus Zixiibacteriota bacterium]